MNQFGFKKALLIILFVLVLFLAFLFYKTTQTFSLINKDEKSIELGVGFDDNYQEENRTDILILGIRGDDDLQYGGDLTDAIMLVSIDTKNNKVALISVPRDIYVTIPRHNGLKEKINYAYAFGVNKGIGGMNLARYVVENVVGVKIDYVAVVDFELFKKMIDIVGGIEINLPKEFIEKTQWGFEFKLPKGKNVLDGETALYYVRSRYSSNDFERARRQQEVLIALAKKLASAGVLANPIKINNLFNEVGKNVKTNLTLYDVVRLSKYAYNLVSGDAISYVIKTGPDGLLKDGFINENYVLYPKKGIGDFSDIRQKVRNIFNE